MDKEIFNKFLEDREAYLKITKMKKFVLVRTYSAGVFAGFLAKRKGKEAELENARRIWYWDGAAVLVSWRLMGRVSRRIVSFRLLCLE